MIRTAHFSRDRRYRYRLGRRWADGPKVCFVLLNPSTADETRDDPTIRRCIAFARAHGYGGLEAVNLYAYVATDPAELRRPGYPVGRGNRSNTVRREGGNRHGRHRALDMSDVQGDRDNSVLRAVRRRTARAT